jgi:hypothetical protein
MPSHRFNGKSTVPGVANAGGVFECAEPRDPFLFRQEIEHVTMQLDEDHASNSFLHNYFAIHSRRRGP